MALATDVEGDATSAYLAKRLARKDLKISRIAYGLPAGSGLEFADELTLSRALEGRREMNGNSAAKMRKSLKDEKPTSGGKKYPWTCAFLWQ